MTKFLIKLFVKNKGEVNNPEVRKQYATLASVTGIILNILLFAGKLLIGIISVSVAIIADAFNNIFDASSSIVTLLGFRISNKHADKKHPLGHGRSEYIAAFIVDMLIIFVGIELFKSSIDKILNPTPLSAGTLTFVILGIAILIKLWLSFFYHKIAKTINSNAIHAASLDSISDTIATTIVLISAIISKYSGILIDGYTGILVACFILFTGVKASKETIEILLGSSPDPDFVNKIYEFVKRYPEVVGIHDVMVHDYGPGRQIVSFHAEIPSDTDFCYAHDIVDCIERDMNKELACIVTIHLDPIVVNDEQVNKMRKLAEDSAKEVDPAFTIHDFRMTSGGKHINLIFDLCIPTDSKLEDQEAARLVSEKISEKNPDCFAVIKAEHPFV